MTAKPPRPVTIQTLHAKKQAGEPIVMLTAYDFLTAQLLDEAGVDSILVGDSLGNVVQGRSTTLPVTLEQMVYHGEMVVRAARRALVIVDLPFGTFQLGADAALRAGVTLVKQTGCAAVKLEATAEQAPVIEALTGAGIPVFGHCGYRPQAVHQAAGKIVQRDLDVVMRDSLSAEKAGAVGLVLECVSIEVAREVSQTLKIPTIGIGAGSGCDGQVLVTPDLLGLTASPVPRFVKRYGTMRDDILRAVSDYASEVRDRSFPSSDQSYT